MTHLGGRSAEFEKSDQDTMGQRSERNTQTHPRCNTDSLPPLSVSTSLYSREYGEFAGNDICENVRRSEWVTGDQGIDTGTESTEGQGSDNPAVSFGPYRLVSPPHDLYTKHITAQ